MIPVMRPIRCRDCSHLRGQIEDGAMILDRCYVYDCEITDEMLDEPCKFYVQKVM